MESESDDEAELDIIDATKATPATKGLSMKVAVSIQTKRGPLQVTLKLDPGADVSCMSEELARKLNAKIVEVEPVSLVGAVSGKDVSVGRATVLRVQLCEDAPVQPIRFYVHKDLLKRRPDFALIGLSDLVGYTFSLDPGKLRLQYHGVESEADPVEPPPFEIDATQAAERPVVAVGEAFSAAQRTEVESTISEFIDVFGPLDATPATLEPFSIELRPDARPRVAAPRWLNRTKLLAVKEYFDREVAQGRYERVTSAISWASPITVVPKGSGGVRICGDYTVVNAATKIPPSLIPDQRQITDFVAGCRFFGKMDMIAGYNQVPNTAAAADVLVVTTPVGMFRPLRMPFGPAGAPAHFQNVVRKLIDGIEGARAFFDDIPIAARTFESFIMSLRKILERARQLHIRFNPAKCILGPTQLPLLGRLVSEAGVRIDPSRVQALQDMVAPKNRKELISFIGLAGWFSQFVPHMSTLLEPLRSLLPVGAQWQWVEEHQRAFDTIRALILSAPTLAHRVQGREVSVRSDASGVGIAAVFFQKNQETDAWELLAAFSRALTPAERKYSTIEQEALAIVWGVTRARNLFIDKLLVITDHSNLQFLRSSSNSRVQRWAVTLSEFDYTVVWAPGRDNSISDFLSRAVAFPDSGIVPQVDLHELSADPDALALDSAGLGLPPAEGRHLGLANKPSPEQIAKIWALGHGDPLVGHLGRQRSIRRILASVSWPGAASDLTKLAEACPTCQKVHAKQVHPRELASTAAEFPFESVFVDFIGPLPKIGEYEYILVCIDRFSHEIVLEAARSTSAQETAKLLVDRWVAQAGCPRLITSDGGPPFTSTVIVDLLEELKIKHHVSAPYHPEGHGAVERVNRDVEQILRGSMRVDKDWTALLKPA
jgi:hypothetical protein